MIYVDFKMLFLFSFLLFFFGRWPMNFESSLLSCQARRTSNCSWSPFDFTSGFWYHTWYRLLKYLLKGSLALLRSNVSGTCLCHYYSRQLIMHVTGAEISSSTIYLQAVFFGSELPHHRVGLHFMRSRLQPLKISGCKQQ